MPDGPSEADLNHLLDANVTLDPEQRVGLLAISGAFVPVDSLATATIPGTLATTLDEAGVFRQSTEIDVDWPAAKGVAGLRELGARYRAPYLLLYRARFIDDSYANNWAWLTPTIIGAFVAPSNTLETVGKLEVSLFDVRTGTILFTVAEPLHGRTNETPFDTQRKLERLKSGLVDAAAHAVSKRVIDKMHAMMVPAPASARSEAERQPGLPQGPRQGSTSRETVQ